ncbi:MAG: IBR domain-containing protein [Caldilineaceae bacterium]
MKYCPNPTCPFFLEESQIAQYLDSAVICPICRTELSDEVPEFAISLHDATDDEWIFNDEGKRLLVLATYLHPKQANLLQNRLQMRNLLSYLSEQVIDLDTFSGAVGKLRLWVMEEDFEQAITLLELYGDE